MYMDGIRVPQRKLDPASFVNKESRSKGLKRKNCELVQVGLVPYIEVTKKLNVGEELYTTYSRGYRIK